jgi:hypothetical protein
MSHSSTVKGKFVLVNHINPGTKLLLKNTMLLYPIHFLQYHKLQHEPQFDGIALYRCSMQMGSSYSAPLRTLNPENRANPDQSIGRVIELAKQGGVH